MRTTRSALPRVRSTGLGAALVGSALVWSGCGEPSLALPAGLSAPPPSTVIDLGPGEFVTLTGAAAVAPIDIPAVDSTRAYAVSIQNASAMPGGEVPIRVVIRRVDLLSRNETAGPASGSGRSVVRRPAEEASSLDRWYGRDEVRFRASVRRQLLAGGARPLRTGRLGAGGRRSTLAVGQQLDLRSPIDAEGAVATCSAERLVTGVVRAVGLKFAIVEDTAVAGTLTPADFAAFIDEADRIVAPVGEAYFGTPTDLDGNGVVIVMITREVNRLGAAGFFSASDLADAEDCATSNEGEVLWLVAPDPLGRFGPPIDHQTIKDRTVGIIAHELQHLVHAGRRIFEGGGDFESADLPWLNEGLSHIAEEVTGLYAAGLHAGANLDFADLDQPEVRARFRRFHLGNFAAVRDYFESTSRVPAIVDVPVTRAEFRRARGFGYLFLRWLADQFAADGPPALVGSVREEEMFRALTLGGPSLLRSTANVEHAVSALGVNQVWGALFGKYSAVPVVDDFAAPGVPLASVLQLETWNLPALYANARDNGFDAHFPAGFPLTMPVLRPEALAATGHVLRTTLLPSTAFYFRIESPHRTPLTRLSLSDLSGRVLSKDLAIQVTIVRMF